MVWRQSIQGSESMEKSVENLKKLIGGVAELGTAGSKVMENGRLDLLDLRQVPAIIAAVRNLGGLDLKELVPESKDMSDAEKAEVSALFQEKFNLKSESANLEKSIEEGMGLLLEGLQAILSLVKLSNLAK